MSKIAKVVLSRVLLYGAILVLVWWWMLWTPGDGLDVSRQPDELELAAQLRVDVEHLAGAIGERNLIRRPAQLEAAAQFIEKSLRVAGYEPQSQRYKVDNLSCRNLEVEIRGSGSSGEVVVVGAHYDSVLESPGADDNASGIAVMLTLARAFAGKNSPRTLRFVAFTNEEPPYFWTDDMGSLRYAKRCRQRGENVVAMLSVESVGFYSTASASQRYHAGLGLVYPSKGDFVAFVGDVFSRPLAHEAIGAFRSTRALASVGAVLPNAIPGVGWSDHWSFWQQGFPGIEVTDTAVYRNPYYHTPHDIPDHLDYHRLARFASGMRRVIGRLTNPASDRS